MSNRKFLVSMTALVSAVAVHPASANVDVDVDVVKVNDATVISQNALVSNNLSPFDFVLKRSDSAVQVLAYHSSHSSHSSHASHSSHYSSRY